MGLCLLLSGCAASSTGRSSSSGPPSLGFVNGDTKHFHTCLEKAVRETAASNMATLQVANSRASAGRELSNIKAMIDSEVDAIIIQSVDSKALDADVAMAKKAGIPLFVTSYTPSDGNDDVLGAVLFRLPEIGRLNAEWISKDADGRQVEVGIVSGDGTSSSNSMVRGFTKALADNVKVVASEPGGYDRSKAKSAASRMIRSHPDLQYVFVANEDMAFGVREALDQAGSTDVRIVTANGTDEGLAALKDGRFSATVSSPVMEMGELAVTSALSLLRGDQTDKIAYVPNRLITEGNADTAPIYCPYDDI
ncbi:sugar ABC transporter substrate-binding protein [Streptomyces zaehneri]|uniref:sugar ABC transporter substrate-binding protein n=1 Tax=Streptomyces zaehneri TaxID=3051180 RepID=UPI0028D8758D|nr:sugar ABC transporter substrate-binding protein [Streptomyces sp. DSM 40713]